jgi:hypothetical protein
MRKFFVFVMVFFWLVSEIPLMAKEIDAKKKCSLKFSLDFETKKLSIEEILTPDQPNTSNGEIFTISAKPMSSLHFRIENINQNKYVVKISDTVVKESEFELPPIFAALFKSSASSPEEIVKSKQLMQQGADAAKERVKSAKEEAEINAAKKSEIEMRLMLEDIDKLENFVKNKKKLSDLMSLIEDIDKMSKSAENLKRFQDDIKKEGEEKLGEYFGDKIKKENWWKESNLSDIFKQAKDCLKGMAENKISYEASGDGKSPIRKFIAESMKDAIEKSLEFDKQMEKIKKILLSYFDANLGPKMFQYIHPKSYTFMGGKLNLMLEIFEKSDEKKENAVYRIDFDICSEKKWFVGASTGFFFSSLRDYAFTLEERVSGENGALQNHIVRKGGEDWATVGLGALIHVGLKLNNWLSPALSMGLAPTNTNGVFQYYGGLSAGLGEQKKLFITGGITLGKVKRLNGYNIDDVFKGAAVDIPTASVIDKGWFLGISYNFLSSKNDSSKKEEKEKSEEKK